MNGQVVSHTMGKIMYNIYTYIPDKYKCKYKSAFNLEYIFYFLFLEFSKRIIQ